VPSNDVPGLSGQECHHVYLGAMFSLSHQAERTRQYVNVNKEFTHWHLQHSLGLCTISGKCVISSTFVTLTPAASRLDAVPPVETIEYLQKKKCQ